MRGGGVSLQVGVAAGEGFGTGVSVGTATEVSLIAGEGRMEGIIGVFSALSLLHPADIKTIKIKDIT